MIVSVMPSKELKECGRLNFSTEPELSCMSAVSPLFVPSEGKSTFLFTFHFSHHPTIIYGTVVSPRGRLLVMLLIASFDSSSNV